MSRNSLGSAENDDNEYYAYSSDEDGYQIDEDEFEEGEEDDVTEQNDDNGMEWNASENPNAAPMNFTKCTCACLDNCLVILFVSIFVLSLLFRFSLFRNNDSSGGRAAKVRHSHDDGGRFATGDAAPVARRARSAGCHSGGGRHFDASAQLEQGTFIGRVHGG